MTSENTLESEEKTLRTLNRSGKDNPFYKHGKYGSKIYETWNWMIQRCHNEKATMYKHYGARGITVCDEWRKFEAFYKDMGDPPFPNATLDRIDNSIGYSKSNCRWATRKEQARNRRSSRFIEFNGESKTLAEWSEIYGIHTETISDRIKRGWTLKDAFTIKPVKGRNQSWRMK